MDEHAVNPPADDAPSADPAPPTRAEAPPATADKRVRITTGRVRVIEDKLRRAITECDSAIEKLTELLAGRDESVSFPAVDGVRHVKVRVERLLPDLRAAREVAAETQVIAREQA